MSAEKKNYNEISDSPAKLQFKFFPAFSEYLLKNKLREFSKTRWEYTLSVNFPALKYYDLSAYTEEQILDLSMKSDEKFFGYAISNRLTEQINESVEKWVADQLPVITRDQIAVDDITLAVYIFKKTVLEFIPEYTKNVQEAVELMREIDDYVLEAESASFHALMNIQEQKIGEINKAVKRNEEQLLEGQKIARLGSFEMSLTGGESYYTPQLYEIFEIEKASTLPEFLQYVFPGDRLKVKTAIEKAMKGEGDYECEYRYQKNGKEKILWSRGVVTFDKDKPVTMKGTVMDITDRHYMLQGLQRNEELYKQAQALSHIGNWTWNINTGKMNWSDELYRIFGLEPQSEEITFERGFLLIHPDDREKRKLQMERSLVTHTMEDYIVRIVTDSGVTKILRGKANVLLDENKNPYKIVGTFQDISEEEKIKTELEKSTGQLAELNSSLKRKNKELERSNKELTSFSYVASHDLQEPLRKIKSFSDLIVEHDFNKLSEDGKNYFERIMSSTIRMQKLIDDLLSFSRIQ
ncbi:MAG: PAS domain-containing sensor histidine kinase, partial [Bacteroidia bacterium]